MTPRPLLVLSADERLRTNLGAAAGPDFRLGACEGWAELRAALRVSPPGSPVVVDPYHGGGGQGAPSPELGRLARDFPSAPVVAALEVTPQRMRDVHTLRDWHVAEVIALPVEGTPRCMERLLLGARARPFVARVGALLPPHLSPRATAALLVAAQTAVGGGRERALAEALHADPGVLAARLSRWGLPRPARLMRWMHSLLRLHPLDDPGRTPANAARAAGLRSVAALSRLARAATGACDAEELRRRGAVAGAMERLLREIWERGERLRERGTARGSA